MLATARELIVAERLDKRVELIEADITALPDRLATADWDGISCVWTLHQLPDFDVLRAALRQIAALRRHSGAAIWIFDFRRLRDPSALPALASCVDPSMAPVLRKDALASEAAGFTEAELNAELTAAGLDNMSSGPCQTTAIPPAHWAPGMNAKSDGASRMSGGLHGEARRVAALLRWGFTAKPF
jgi:tRNA (cmo5U34)-methyltransferase